MKLIAKTTLAALLCTTAAQAETRGLGAHEHGSGALNIAFEGDAVYMEFEAPGADIVGFEHEAKSSEDRAAIDAAVSTLAKPLDLFKIVGEAGCVVTAAAVELVTGGDDHAHDEAHAHDAHAHDDHGHDDDHAQDAHAHDDHGHDDDHAHDDHGHDDDHAHDAHAHDDDHHDDEVKAEAGGESHTEFHAEYALTCSEPGAITAIDFAYFEQFPNALELDIQMISEKGARGFEVERDAPRLDLAGAI